MTPIELQLFLLSFFLLFFTSLQISAYSNTPRDRFWVFIAVSYFQISGISLLLSPFHLLKPPWFLGIQIGLALIVLLISRSVKIQRPAGLNKVGDKSFKGTLKQATNKRVAIILCSMLPISLIIISLLQRIVIPIHTGDAMYYHASRPLYWIKNASMAPYNTANSRQITFAFGSNIIFMWPVLFTHSEFVGRLVHWLGLPVGSLGFYTILQELGRNKFKSLLGMTAFLSMTVVFDLAITLEPLIWVCVFALGTSYWALRIPYSPWPGWTISGLASFGVLTANAKNFGLALVPAGLLPVIIQTICKKKACKDRFTSVRHALSQYIIVILVIILVSGFGLLLYQNYVHYGNPLASPHRADQNIAEFSPYQFYVHTVRAVAVLGEVSLPIGHNIIEKIGNRVISLVGADRPLPKETTVGWIGHYNYTITKWPSGSDNFGISGIVILLALALVILKTGSKIRTGLLDRKAVTNFICSKKFSYLIVASALFIGTLYILRWITCGTRSFLAPGVVVLLPLALNELFVPYRTRKLKLFVVLLIVVFGIFFAYHQINRLSQKVNNTGFKWKDISYAQINHHQLIEDEVPNNATLFLIVGGNFMDYTAFGRNFTRIVKQITQPLDKNRIEEINSNHPNAYIYVNERYRGGDYSRGMFRSSIKSLKASEFACLVGNNGKATLFLLGNKP